MTPEPQLPRLLRWCFIAVDSSGYIRWRWEARNHRSDVVLESTQDFDTYTECVDDAHRSGYVAPESRLP